MQGRRGGNNFFDFDPLPGFSGFGGLGGHQSMLSSFFGGRDPFDDPFFTRPFGSPFGSMFESGFFGPRGSLFAGARPTGFIEQQEPQRNKRKGPVIEELNSDDENVEDGGAGKMKGNPRKHSRLGNEPFVEIPDDEEDDRSNKLIRCRNDFNNKINNAQPQSQSYCYTFQNSTVSYGGANGAYYTKSMTRRAGSDGVTFEEMKEADSTNGQANHRISRGLHNKGHTLARKLSSDGKVDTMQTLHNLNEDELAGFEQAWEGNAGRHLTGWRQRLDGGNSEPGSSGQTSRGGWALPSPHDPDPEHPGSSSSHIASGNDAARMQHSGRSTTHRRSHRRTRA